MRRMATTKQLEYVNELSQVAEKGFKVGTYPHEITGYAGYCDLDYSIEQMIENEEIDFENHEVSTGDLYFYYPNLLKYYGLGESGDEGSVLLILDDGFSFPETINNAESLKKWMLSEDFVNLIPSAGGYIKEYILSNEVAVYSPKNYWQVSLENNQLLINETFVCDQGEGEEIVDASDPVSEPTLKVENLEADNIISNQIKTWYFIEGNFTSNADVLYIIITQKAVYNNQRKRYICWAINNDDDSINEYDINFTNGKIYDSAGIEINLDSATVQLINALNGDVEDEVDL